MQICCFIALFGAFPLLLSDDFSSSKATFLLTFRTLHLLPGPAQDSSMPQLPTWLLPELEACVGHESWQGWGRGAVPNRSRLLFLCNWTQFHIYFRRQRSMRVDSQPIKSSRGLSWR